MINRFAPPSLGLGVMRATAFFSTYNGLGTGPFLSCCTNFLFEGAPDVGTCIAEIEFYPHCRNSDPVLPNLQNMADNFEKRLQTLPISRVYRRYRRGFISYQSAIVYSESLMSSQGQAIYPNPAQFSILISEMSDVLSLLRPKFKRSDEFDIDRLISHVLRRKEEAPADAQALTEIQQRYSREYKDRRTS